MKFKVWCKECGYTWYPDEKKWKGNPDAPEPDCPNPECKNYGTGMHDISKGSIWYEGYIPTFV